MQMPGMMPMMPLPGIPLPFPPMPGLPPPLPGMPGIPPMPVPPGEDILISALLNNYFSIPYSSATLNTMEIIFFQ